MEVPGQTAAISKPLQSELNVQLYCLPCDRDGPRVPAYGYCQDCAEHLCETCYKSHRKPAPCRNHVLLDKTQMPKSEPQIKPQAADNLTEHCQQHSGKVIEYFCHEHNLLECSHCIIVHHRSCTVDYIPDVSRNFEASDEYRQLLQSLQSLQEDACMINNLAKTNKKTIHENKDVLQASIKEYRQEINSMFDKLEEQLQQQMDDLFAKEIIKNDGVITSSDQILTNITNLREKFNILQTGGKINALYTAAKSNEIPVKEYESSVGLLKKNTISTYMFEPNISIQKAAMGRIIPKEYTECEPVPKQSETMGQLSSKQGVTGQPAPEEETVCDSNEKTDVLQSMPPYEHGQLQPNGTDMIFEKLKAQKSGNIKVRTSEDMSCRITGVVHITKDRIAVTDRSNEAVKIVDTNWNRVLSYKTLPSRPAGLEMLPSGELVVALPEEYKIIFLAVFNELSEVRQVEVDRKCYDLAYCDGKLIVTSDNTDKVQIMDEKGCVLKTIRTGTVYRKSTVTVIRKNRAIYVSDRYESIITKINWNGEVEKVYKDSNLKGPHGLVALGGGFLLVCSSENHTVHLISSNLDKGRVILSEKDGLYFPASIALDREQNKLFIGSEDCNSFLEVFELNLALLHF